MANQENVVSIQNITDTDRTKWLTARPGERFCVRVPAAATNGAYSVIEIVSEPGDSTSLHVHEKEDEYLLVLEGSARVVLGEQSIEASIGQIVEMKRGIPHGWGNPGDKPARLLLTATPGGCEEVLVIIAQGGEVDLTALAAKFQITRLGPSILG